LHSLCSEAGIKTTLEPEIISGSFVL